VLDPAGEPWRQFGEPCWEWIGPGDPDYALSPAGIRCLKEGVYDFAAGAIFRSNEQTGDRAIEIVEVRGPYAGQWRLATSLPMPKIAEGGVLVGGETYQYVGNIVELHAWSSVATATTTNPQSEWLSATLITTGPPGPPGPAGVEVINLPEDWDYGGWAAITSANGVQVDANHPYEVKVMVKITLSDLSGSTAEVTLQVAADATRAWQAADFHRAKRNGGAGAGSWEIEKSMTAVVPAGGYVQVNPFTQLSGATVGAGTYGWAKRRKLD
jgi:hypothetical protein